MRYALLAFTAIVVACAGGCTFTRVESTPAPSVSSDGPARIGSRVYVYSFIDLRVAELGPDFMQAFERLLAQQLREAGVESRQLWYGKTPLKSVLERGASTGSTRVPLPEVVAANREREAEFGARYRLVVIPSEISRAGAAVTVRTRWDLYDPKTNRSVWTGRADTIQTFWGANVNEGAEERAQKLVTGMVAEMKRVGLL